jgi:exopolyphosphatase / guanosine-5'-triphosphate,3'-diphosphate pyrophosphatase
MSDGLAPGGSADLPAAGSVRVAAIDCGTNSLRLLIADIDPRQATLADRVRRMEIVRLGQGVDATGRLAADALARTFGVLEEYARILDDVSPSAVRMVATSATRDAANSAEFVRGVTRILGVPPGVLSGDEEAFLSYTGATAELARPGPGLPAGDRFAPPYLVVDIGGGSTEFVLGGEQIDGSRSASPRPGTVAAGSPAGGGTGPARAAETGAAGSPAAGSIAAAADIADPAAAGESAVGGVPGAGTALAAVSVDIGCVRMTERHLRSDPPTDAEIVAATADIDTAVAEAAARLRVRRARTLIGLAGSVTTVAGIALDLPGYDARRSHHARIPAATVHAVACMLLSQTRAQRARIGVMHPGRVDVIGAGALVLDRIVTRLGFAEVVASEHDILDGIAWSLVDSRAG